MRVLGMAAAAVLALAGCFGSHGMPGGGGDPDAGPPPPPPPDGATMCRALEGSAEVFDCPGAVEYGTEVVVAVRSSPSLCCSSGTMRASADRVAPDRFEVSVDWTACDCCEGCRCVGPIEETRLSLGVLEPGSYRVEGCTVTVTPPAECRPRTATETRMPRVIFTDQRLAVTLIERETSFASCGCTPRVTDGGGSLNFGLEVCDCCDACDCVDFGYEASREVGPLMPGTYDVGIPHGVGQVTVVEPGDCAPLPATGVEIVGPDEMLQHGGPALWWAHVSGEEARCCSPPMPAVEEGTGPMGEIALSLQTCVREDCLCDPPAPGPIDAWHSLGALSSGTYTVVAGTRRTTFTVP